MCFGLIFGWDSEKCKEKSYFDTRKPDSVVWEVEGGMLKFFALYDLDEVFGALFDAILGKLEATYIWIDWGGGVEIKDEIHL